MDEAENNLEDYAWTISDRYVVVDRIGTGGMAEIFRAKMFGAAGFEKEFAIKLIRPHLLNDEEFVEMFVNEAKLSVALYHTNIVQVFDFGLHDDRYYIVMEYVEGKDLLDILARCVNNNIRIPLDIGLHIVMELLKGLDFAHRATDVTTGESLNIIHRDISPSNILVSYTGGVKIGDFGVAKARLKQSMSRTGTLKGKVGYMSPEQVIGDPIDYRSDIFAAGIILFETISMSRLFRAENDFGTMIKVRDCDIDAALARIQALPSGLERILRTALARDVSERYQTAGAFFQDLSSFAYDNRLIVDNTRVSNLMRRLFATDIDRQKKKRHAENQNLKAIKSAQAPSPKPTIELPKSSDSVLDLPDIPSHESSDARIEPGNAGSGPNIQSDDIVRPEEEKPQPSGKLNDLLARRKPEDPQPPRPLKITSPIQSPPVKEKKGVPPATPPTPLQPDNEPLTFDDVTRIKNPQDVLVPEQAIVAGFVDDEVTQPPGNEVIAPPPIHLHPSTHHEQPEPPRVEPPREKLSPSQVVRPTLGNSLKNKIKSKYGGKEREKDSPFAEGETDTEEASGSAASVNISPETGLSSLHGEAAPQDTIAEVYTPLQSPPSQQRPAESPFAQSPLQAMRSLGTHKIFEKPRLQTPPSTLYSEPDSPEEQSLRALLKPYEQRDFFFRDSDGRILGPLQGKQLYYFLTSDRAGDISFDSVLWESIAAFTKSIERREEGEPTFSEEEPPFEDEEISSHHPQGFSEAIDTREESRSPLETIDDPSGEPTEGSDSPPSELPSSPGTPGVPGPADLSPESEEADRRRDSIVPPPPKGVAPPPPPFGQLRKKRLRRPSAVDAFEKMMAAASELEELSSSASYDSSDPYEDEEEKRPLPPVGASSLPLVNERHRSHVGKLSELSFTRLLFQLLKEHQTGRLLVSRLVSAGEFNEMVEVRKEFYFEKGRPVSALSNLDQERLGDFLIERNLVTQEQLDAALERTKKWGGRLGDSLVANNVISAHQIVNYLRMQFEEKLLEVFEWEDGDYQFFENQVTSERNYALDIDLFRIISEGCLTRIPFEFIAKTYRSRMNCLIDLTPNFESGLDHFKLGPAAIRILRAYNSGDTLEGIKRKTPPNKYELSARIFYLMNQVDYIALENCDCADS